MHTNDLKQRLRDGQLLFGLMVTYPAPGIVEGMCKGWDFVWIDGQHGQMSYDSIIHFVRAVEACGLASVIRVPQCDAGILGMYADIVPAALMIPMVNNAAEATAIAKALHFAPRGHRSYGGRRAVDLFGREYCNEDNLLVIAQIETVEAAENAGEIIAVDGIDALFFGADDMKLAMGLPVNTSIVQSKPLQDALRRTATAAKDAGKFSGGVAPSGESAALLADLGFQLLAGPADSFLLRTAAAQKLTELRSAACATSAKGAKDPQPQAEPCRAQQSSVGRE